MIDQVMQSIEVNEPSTNIAQLPQPESEVFEGFGMVDSDQTVGSARLNFLRALKEHSEDSRRFTANLRRGHRDLIRQVWVERWSSNKGLSSKGSFSDSGLSKGVPPQKINFDSSFICTRSRGKPDIHPNVQPKILERKSSKCN